MTQFTGEIIAFLTVLCWTVGSQFFEAAGKRVGSVTVNLVRLVLAAIFLCLTLLITKGQLIPLDFPLRNWGWLAVSGVIGFALGDMFLFKAFVEIGPRISMLVMSLSAPVTALIGWGFLGEIYKPAQWLGIVVTLSGVAMVILERNGNGSTETAAPRNRILKKITPHGNTGVKSQGHVSGLYLPVNVLIRQRHGHCPLPTIARSRQWSRFLAVRSLCWG